MIQLANNLAAVLGNSRSYYKETNDITLTVMTTPRPVISHINILTAASNQQPVRVQIVASNSHFMVQWSSNLVDWVTPLSPYSCARPGWPYGFDCSNTGTFGGSSDSGINAIQMMYDVYARGQVVFFRGFEDRFQCKSNLRKIARLKETWALEKGFIDTDTPTDSDLFTGYRDKPVCPANGTYELRYMGELPRCTFLPIHALP